jgi:hypothetical membrane protein
VTARSVKLMLLGIALLLFGMVFPSTINPVLIYYFGLALDRGMLGAMIVSILPVMGLVLVLVGFFKREACLPHLAPSRVVRAAGAWRWPFPARASAS